MISGTFTRTVRSPCDSNNSIRTSFATGIAADDMGHTQYTQFGNAVVANTTITRNNATQSAYFNGATPALLAFTVGPTVPTGDFTIEGYYYQLSLATGGVGLYSQRTTNTGLQFGIFLSNAGHLQFYINNGSGVTKIDPASPAKISSLNTWTHYAVTRQGQVFRSWLGGIYLGTFTSSIVVSEAPSCIGADSITANTVIPAANAFNGHFDQFRISNFARYTGATNFTPPINLN